MTEERKPETVTVINQSDCKTIEVEPITHLTYMKDGTRRDVIIEPTIFSHEARRRAAALIKNLTE